MISWQQMLPWAVLLCLIASAFGSIMGSYIGIRICSRHWQCPLYTRKNVEDWMKDIVESRKRSENKVVRTDPECPPEILPEELIHDAVPVR